MRLMGKACRITAHFHCRTSGGGEVVVGGSKSLCFTMTVCVGSAAVDLFAGRIDDNLADRGETSEGFNSFKWGGGGGGWGGERKVSHVEKQEQGRTQNIQIATVFCQFRKLCSSPILGV